MASKLSKAFEEHLVCSICSEIYDDPRTLPCMHTYCGKCIKQWIDSCDGPQLSTCPDCREPFRPEDLKAAFQLKSIAKILSTSEEVDVETTEVTSRCSSCNSLGEKLVFCFDCEHFLCINCSLKHRAHNLQSTADAVITVKESMVKKVEELNAKCLSYQSFMFGSHEKLLDSRKQVVKIQETVHERCDALISAIQKYKSEVTTMASNFIEEEKEADEEFRDDLNLDVAKLHSSVEYLEGMLIRNSETEILQSRSPHIDSEYPPRIARKQRDFTLTELKHYDDFDVAKAVEKLITSPEAERVLDLDLTIKGRPGRIMSSNPVRKSDDANIKIENLDKSIDTESLYNTFSSFGNILSCKIAVDELGNPEGFVHFKTVDAAQEAIGKLDGMLLNDKKVSIYHCKPEEDKRTEGQEGGMGGHGVKLYIKNLDKCINGARLRHEFEPYGTITSAEVIKDQYGKSKGFGFVSLSSPEEAKKAIAKMNGRILISKPWYVAVAQCERERKAQLDAQFMHRISGLRVQQMHPSCVQGMVGQVPSARGMRKRQPRGMRRTRPRLVGQMPYAGQPMQLLFADPLNPSVLAAATQQDQKQMLGERLFPLIQSTQPELAGKITGMLLELDNAELLHMLESREALQMKVDEAVSVLRDHHAKDVATAASLHKIEFLI